MERSLPWPQLPMSHHKGQKEVNLRSGTKSESTSVRVLLPGAGRAAKRPLVVSAGGTETQNHNLGQQPLAKEPVKGGHVAVHNHYSPNWSRQLDPWRAAEGQT